MVLSTGLTRRLQGARASPRLITATAPQTGIFPPHRPANGSLGNVWALIAFCPVSVSVLRHGSLSRQGRTHSYRSTPEAWTQTGQSPTPSHPLRCLPEESFAMKEQAPPRTGEIGAQAESLHRRQPAGGPQPRVRRWLSQAIPFSLQTSVCPTKKGGAWGRPPPHPPRGQSGSDHYSLTPE